MKHLFTKENSPVFCNDVGSVMEALAHQHNTTSRVFVESSNLAYAVYMKDSYDNMTSPNKS
jgi:hypothetical protein